MKNNSLLLIACVAAAATGPAFAQSCASPSRILKNDSGHHIVSGTTCAPAINQLGTLCGAFNSPENDVIYYFTIDPGTRTSDTLTLSTTEPTWNSAFLYLSGSCGGGTNCVDVGDTGGPGSIETMSTPQAAGAYFLVVTSSPGTGGCGAYTVDAGGRLPVALKSFSID